MTGARGWQLRRRDCRLVLVRAIQRETPRLGSERRAIEALREGYEAQTLDDALMAACRGATRGRLSRASIAEWVAKYKGHDSDRDALLPQARQRGDEPPAWLHDFLKIYRRPGKPSVSAAFDELKGAGLALPGLREVQRTIKGLGAVERHRGRMGPRALKDIRPYKKRTFDHMDPGDVFLCDGHTADLEVAHPTTGQPFRPEMISVLDARTRDCVAWIAGEAESAWLVAAALRDACLVCIPCIWYVDRGRGFSNRHLGDGVLEGILARLGISLEHSLPYNSQARGIIERFHQSCWIRGARCLPGFCGKGMDPEARKRFFRRTRSDLKTFGESRVLMSWDEFLVWCQVQVDRYNTRGHSSLGGQSPKEVWAAAEQAGWTPTKLQPDEAVELFRPRAAGKVIRGLVQYAGGMYSAPELEQYHGERVEIAYDINDSGRIWVYDGEGREIAVAELDGHATPFFPQSALERARAKREAGQMTRLARKAEKLTSRQQQALPGSAIDQAAAALWDSRHSEQLADVEAQAQRADREDEGNERYAFWLKLDRRIREDGYAPTDQERAWHHHYPNSAEHRSLCRLIAEFGDEVILSQWAAPGASPRPPWQQRPPAELETEPATDGGAVMPLRRPGPGPALSIKREEKTDRRKRPPGAGHQRSWTFMRARGGEPWCWKDLEAAGGGEKRSINAYIALLRSVGYVELAAPASSGGAAGALYRLINDTGPVAPQKQKDGGVWDYNANEHVRPEARRMRVVGGRGAA